MKRIIRFSINIYRLLNSINDRLPEIEKCIEKDRKGCHLKTGHWNE